MQKTFTLEDQHSFAALSGDFNPVHVDPIAARRLMFGAPIVHGMHILLWALSEWSALNPYKRPTQIKATFARPLRVAEQATLNIAERANSKTRITFTAAGAKAGTFQINWTDEAVATRHAAHDTTPPQTAPILRDADDLAGKPHGQLVLHWPAARADALFPGLAASIGQNWTSAIATASRLVGVDCPGLHSVYGDLQLQNDPTQSSEHLSWAVTTYDTRFRYCDIALAGAGLSGRIGAFLRPPALAQPDMAALTNYITPYAFSGQHALIIGGSRGLGEVAAKLLAVGGAQVSLTYAHGKDDAARVARQIGNAGGQADILQVDVTRPNPALLSALAPSHLLYFATPFAFSGARGVFNPKLFQGFTDVYLDGFRAIFDAVHGPNLNGILYPSSVAVTEKPDDMVEYAAAKRDGEEMCKSLADAHPGIRFMVPRLPRLETDQTQSLSQIENADPAPILTKLLAELMQ